MSERRYQFTLTFDKGLDKASSPFEGNPSRALDCLNYVYRDGKVQKRHGVSEIAQAERTPYRRVAFDSSKTEEYSENSLEWNGLWRLTAEDGKEHLVGHVGKLLYEISEADGGRWRMAPIVANSETTRKNGKTYVSCFEFENYKSCAVIGNKRLYFLGGNQFVMVRFPPYGNPRIEPIANSSDAYVPTTTVSITYENSAVNARQSYDQVNLLQDFRKNTLLSGTGREEGKDIVTEDFEYTLDSPMVCRDAKRDMASFSMAIRERVVEKQNG